MAAERPNLGLQIALIIFVMLTIVLAVTTFIFYKEQEEARVALKAADDKRAEAEKTTGDRMRDIAQLKELVGKGDQADVPGIMGEFERHKQVYAATMGADVTKTYPAMLEYYELEKRKLEADNIALNKQLEDAKSKFDNDLKLAQTQQNDLKTQLTKQTEEILAIRTEFGGKSQEYRTELDKKAQIIAKGQNEVLAQREKYEEKQAELAKVVREKSIQLNDTQTNLKTYTEFNAEAPDGRIVGINQTKGTVWIDAGSADGLRHMTTFAVYPHDVGNAQDPSAVKKASIQVIRIVNEHLAEARITEDIATNPIVRDDKIFSPIFRRGVPDSFAVVGFIDLDGDGRSDLSRLTSLIKQNGGNLDVAIDDKGQRIGTKITPSTKFLVLGKQPDEKSDEKMLQEYRKMLDEAEANGVRHISLSDFLVYMGYEGRERSIGLGAGANPDQFKAQPGRGVQDTTTSPFQRRRPVAGSAY
jgi:hypothetical protein